MSDLETWLRAQLDEDERIAREAVAEEVGSSTKDLGLSEAIGYPCERYLEISPHRVLSEVLVKRALLYEVGRTRVLRLLAAPYSGRAGFHPEWSVELDG